MTKKLTHESFTYLMDTTYQRIEQNKKYDINFKPYSIELLKTMLDYYESIEEYEKCAKINQIIKDKTSHEENYDNRGISA